MPRKPGVSKVRVTARRSNSVDSSVAGPGPAGPGPAGVSSSFRLSQRNAPPADAVQPWPQPGPRLDRVRRTYVARLLRRPAFRVNTIIEQRFDQRNLDPRSGKNRGGPHDPDQGYRWPIDDIPGVSMAHR